MRGIVRQKLDYRDYMVCHLKGVGGLFARRNAAKRHGEKLADIPVDWSDWSLQYSSVRGIVIWFLPIPLCRDV